MSSPVVAVLSITCVSLYVEGREEKVSRRVGSSHKQSSETVSFLSSLLSLVLPAHGSLSSPWNTTRATLMSQLPRYIAP